MIKTVKDTITQLQEVLAQPHKKIAETLRDHLGFLNLETNSKNHEEPSPQKNDKVQTLQDGKITWIDIKSPARKEIGEIAQKYPFHPLHLEDCISKGQIPKLEHNGEDKYLFLLLRFPYYKNGEDSITINQICFFLGKDYLVSVHENSNDAISSVFNECKENPQTYKEYTHNSSSRLLYTLISKLTEDLFNLLRLILVEVDQTEGIVFDDKVSGVFKIGQLRRKILTCRRVIGPLRTLLKDLTVTINKFSKTNLSVYFDNAARRVDRAWEMLEQGRETVDIYKDADFTISTEKTNKILSALTIVFTLSIPATVISSFYGMNILLPGGIEAGTWTFLGNYTAFLIILVMATLPAISMYLFFRKKGWL